MKENVFYAENGKRYLLNSQLSAIEYSCVQENDENPHAEKIKESSDVYAMMDFASSKEHQVSFWRRWDGPMGTMVISNPDSEYAKMRGICEINDRVYLTIMGRFPQLDWRWKNWFVHKGRETDSTIARERCTVYSLADKSGETRNLEFDHYSIYNEPTKKVLSYLFSVVSRYESWADYDEKADMLTPREESYEENRKHDAERQAEQEWHQNWMSRFNDRMRIIKDEITSIAQINSDAGPGSRRIAGKRLEDLWNTVHQAEYIQFEKPKL